MTRNARLIAFPALLATTLAVLGCKKTSPASNAPRPPAHAQEQHRDHADHDHADHDGHDHDEHAAHDHADDHADEVVLTPETQARYGVKVERAQRLVLQPTLTAPARVSFNQEAMAHVGSPLRGRATEIQARLGDTMTAGQTLLIVESPELGEAQAEFLQRRIAAAAAGPATDLAKAAWDRAQSLYDQSQGITLTEVQRREAEYKAALAAQQSAQGSVAAAEHKLELLGMSKDAISALAQSGKVAPRFPITAPIAGAVVEREVTPGELVGPDTGPLLVLADTTTLWVLADIPEQKAPSIAAGAPAWVSTSSGAGERYRGAVSHVSAVVNPTTRTAQARIAVPAAEFPLKPGMFATVEIATSTTDDKGQPVIAVPEDAIQTVNDAPSIFVPVEGEPNTFALRTVTTRKPVHGLVPIDSGLSEGEPFVAAGSFILKAELGKGAAAHEH